MNPRLLGLSVNSLRQFKYCMKVGQPPVELGKENYPYPGSLTN